MPTNFWWNAFSAAIGILVILWAYFMLEAFWNWVTRRIVRKATKGVRTGPAMPNPKHIPDPPPVKKTINEWAELDQQAIYNLTNKRIHALEEAALRDKLAKRIPYPISYNDIRATHRLHRMIYFDNRQDAEAVLDRLVEILGQYGNVSVGDYYDLVGETAKYADMKIGWTNLYTGGIIIRSRAGYTIDLPRPKNLD